VQKESDLTKAEKAALKKKRQRQKKKEKLRQ